MTKPNIPNIVPDIDLDSEEVLNLILASIALEELSLAHLLNAEAEKLDFVLGTGITTIKMPPTIAQLLALNRSIESVLLAILYKEIILLKKLQETTDFFGEIDE